MDRTRRFHCLGTGFDPWWGNKDPVSCMPKKKKKDMINKTFSIVPGTLSALTILLGCSLKMKMEIEF